MRIISVSDLQEWSTYLEQVRNGWHMSLNDYRDFIRLNHLVLDTAGAIHNDNMLGTSDLAIVAKGAK